MKKTSEWINLIGRAAFTAAFAVQTVLALIWGVLNITLLQNYEESAIYLSLAERGGSDGFHLFGYVLFVMFAKKVESVTHLPYQSVLYVIQIILCEMILYAATAAFLRAMTGERIRARYVLGLSVFLLGNVYMWRLMFAVLPDGISVCILLLVLSHLILWIRRIGDEKSYVYLFPSLSGCLFLGFLSWKYFWTAVAVSLILLLGGLIKSFAKKKEVWKKAPFSVAILFVILAAIIGLVMLENRSIQKKTVPEYKATYSITADIAKRFQYPNPYDTIDNYPITDEESEPSELSKEAVIKEAMKEYFSLVTSPVILSFREYPFGSTPNPLYLNLMWQKTPRLTGIFVLASSLGFALSVIVSLFAGVVGLVASPSEVRKRNLLTYIITAAMIAGSSFVIFMLSVPVFDYRNAMCAYGLWAFLTGLIIMKRDEGLIFVGKEVKWQKQH
jgi:heme exporter protein D